MARKKTTPLVEDFDNIPEEALVPESEQPYPIPKHWKWVRLGSVCEVNPPKQDITSVPSDMKVTFIPMAAVSDETGQVEDAEVRKLYRVSKGYTSFSSGDVLFAKITPCMENGKSAIVPDLINGLGYGSTEFFVLRPSPVLNAQILHTFVRQESFRAKAREVMMGAVGQQRVPKHFLKQFPFPLPPIDEQHEIITYLEANLAKIDQVTERLESFLKSSETRVERLFEAAVQGYLTNDWRSQQVGLKSEWTTRTLGSLGAWGGGGTPKKSATKYWADGSIRWVTPKDMKKWIIEVTQDHVTEAGVAESSATLYEGPAVCIVVRSGILRRTLPSAVIDGKFTVNQDIKVLHSIDKEVNIEFVHFWLIAREAYIRSFASKSGTTVESIDFKKLKNSVIELPSTEEQGIIVDRVEMLLGSANRVTELVSNSLEAISQVRSRLIAAALAGQLTPAKT